MPDTDDVKAGTAGRAVVAGADVDGTGSPEGPVRGAARTPVPAAIGCRDEMTFACGLCPEAGSVLAMTAAIASRTKRPPGVIAASRPSPVRSDGSGESRYDEDNGDHHPGWQGHG